MNRTFSKKAFAFIVFIIVCSIAKAQNISTLTSGINMPWGTAIDASGNIYVAGYADNFVWKINSTSGTKTAIAGTGAAAFSGDGGLATSAKLNSPSAVALDASGNVYIADMGNMRIRKITVSSGIITTIAGTGAYDNSGNGGAASSASFMIPIGITLDGAGNIYIADAGDNRIRKINASDGKINVVAGNGATGYSGDGGQATSAAINYPMGVTVSASGIIYIADTDNHRIRKVATNGVITTIAGNGTGSFSGDGGLATSATLNGPGHVALDGSGNLYISDANNNRIRKINASDGKISTIAGSGTSGNSGENVAATSAQLSVPQSVVLYGGSIFIASTNANTIRKMSNAYTLLPVTLKTFEAELKGQYVLLNWSTVEEINSNFFEIEYSEDGRNWTTLGKVQVNGSGSSYSYNHSSPAAENYYRLKQVDIDGRYTYSETRKVNAAGGVQARLYPNPVIGSTVMLDLTASPANELTYTISNASGLLISTGVIRNRVEKIALPTAAKGFYLLRLSTGETIKFEKK